MRKHLLIAVWIIAFGAVAVATPARVDAATYPGTKCVADKLKAAGKKCRGYLKLYGINDKLQGNYPGLAGKLANVSTKFNEAWAKAEAKAAAKGADCSETTLSVGATEAMIESAADAIVAEVNTGLNLSNSDDANCGAAILKAASSKCGSFLQAEGNYIQKLATDPDGVKRASALSKASAKFSGQFAGAIDGGCPTAATESGIESDVDDLVADLVLNSTVSQSVSDTGVTTITPGPVEYQGRTFSPICSGTTPYHFFVKRGSENKVLFYFQGGGACWSFLTCGLIGTFDRDVQVDHCVGGTNAGEVCDTLADCPDQGPGTVCSPRKCEGESNDREPCDTLSDCPDQSGDVSCSQDSDSPQHFAAGFGDLSNPANPFKDWNIVFVSYCTGDIHFGDAEQTYFGGGFGTEKVEHRGFVNARVVEKWAREHFVNPDEVFVTGSSAGAYGAFFNAPLLHDVWPAADFSVLADAGNGVITQAFLDNNFPRWNFEANLPNDIPGVQESIEDGTGIVGYTAAVATAFPETNWAHYTTAYDGSTGGQTGFYNVMVNDTNNVNVAAAEWPTWWEESCTWNDLMRQQAIDQAAASPSNYRYYIGRGSRHTVWGSNKVYSPDTTGGETVSLVDWVNSMRAGDLGWVNFECTNCGTILPGDPAPSPLEAPFEQQGPDVVINCGP